MIKEQKIIKNKVGLLRLAQQLRNVSQACHTLGYSRHSFWSTMPSKTLLAALTADALIGTFLTFVSIQGLAPLPWWQRLIIFAYAMVACLMVNDTIKVALIKWRIPSAVARTRVNMTPQIAKRE